MAEVHMLRRLENLRDVSSGFFPLQKKPSSCCDAWVRRFAYLSREEENPYINESRALWSIHQFQFVLTVMLKLCMAEVYCTQVLPILLQLHFQPYRGIGKIINSKVPFSFSLMTKHGLHVVESQPVLSVHHLEACITLKTAGRSCFLFVCLFSLTAIELSTGGV